MFMCGPKMSNPVTPAIEKDMTTSGESWQGGSFLDQSKMQVMTTLKCSHNYKKLKVTHN